MLQSSPMILNLPNKLIEGDRKHINKTRPYLNSKKTIHTNYFSKNLNRGKIFRLVPHFQKTFFYGEPKFSFRHKVLDR